MNNSEINLHYWPGVGGLKNFGDELSLFIMQKLLPEKKFDCNKNYKEYSKNLIAIGSYLQTARDNYYIFGSGLRHLSHECNFSKLNVIAVRGPLTRKYLLQKKINCPEVFGDPALLVSKFYKPNKIKKLSNKIGIVPHITDQTNYNIDPKQFYVIKPTQSWKDVIDQIYSCKAILSSSLHGLICADAYKIPNLWIKYSKLEEGEFKFWDYLLSQKRDVSYINHLSEFHENKLYKGGNKIALSKLVKKLYSSDLCLSKNKIAVLYYIPPSESEKYKNWHDGFTAAIDLVKKEYDVSMINMSSGDPDLSEYEWVFVKEGFGGGIFNKIKSKKRNFKLGIFVSASNKIPTHEELNAFDIIFYETRWYYDYAKLNRHHHAYHAFGIDSSVMQKKDLNKTIDALFVVSIVSYKRPWEIVREKGRKVCVGNVVDHKIKDFLLRYNVEILPFVDYKNLADIYNMSKKCIVPCEIHGGGERAVLEARSCGVEVEVAKDNLKLQELKFEQIFDHQYYANAIINGVEEVCKKRKISFINPSALKYKSVKYILYRGEEYRKNKTPPIAFNKSKYSYWLDAGDGLRQITFNFNDYSYKSIRRVDLLKRDNISMIEDIRMIEDAVSEENGEIKCLATCTLIPYTEIHQGQVGDDGEYDLNKPVGLSFTFKAAFCEVNLTTAEINFIDYIDKDSQLSNEKNWMCFKKDGEFFVIYSMFPLIYDVAKSVNEISFKDKNLNQRNVLRNSTNPILINGNKYGMICHERLAGEFEYQFYFVTFDVNGRIIENLNKKVINLPSKSLYCSSILKSNNSEIEVFAGVADTDHEVFKIHMNFDIDSKSIVGNSLINKLVFIDNSLKEEKFIKDLFEDLNYDIIHDEALNILYEKSVIVYSDFLSKDLSIYDKASFKKFEKKQAQRFDYLKKLGERDCLLVHLGDFNKNANIDHYKYFKYIFRQFYRQDCSRKSVSFIPLGYID